MIVEGADHILKRTPSSIDSTEVQLVQKTLVNSLREKGYWTAAVDTVLFSPDTVKLKLSAGRPFSRVYTKLNFQDSALFANKFYRAKSHEDDFDHVLVQLENKGYPFASVELKQAKISGDTIYLDANVASGMLVENDSLEVEPSDILKPEFMSAYLGINEGKVYQKRKVDEISDRLSYFPFLEVKAVNVSYQLKKAKVKVEIEKKAANYFDGVLGMVPEEEGGVQFTGELNLQLKNLFKSAKELSFHWQQIRPESQKLDVQSGILLYLGHL